MAWRLRNCAFRGQMFVSTNNRAVLTLNLKKTEIYNILILKGKKRAT